MKNFNKINGYHSLNHSIQERVDSLSTDLFSLSFDDLEDKANPTFKEKKVKINLKNLMFRVQKNERLKVSVIVGEHMVKSHFYHMIENPYKLAWLFRDEDKKKENLYTKLEICKTELDKVLKLSIIDEYGQLDPKVLNAYMKLQDLLMKQIFIKEEKERPKEKTEEQLLQDKKSKIEKQLKGQLFHMSRSMRNKDQILKEDGKKFLKVQQEHNYLEAEKRKKEGTL